MFVLIHETYGWEYSDYDTHITLFKDEISAKNYLKYKKQMLLDDILKEFEFTDEKQFMNSSMIIDYDNSDDNFYVHIEDWGYEYLRINNLPIMELYE